MSIVFVISYLVYYNILLQNMTDIIADWVIFLLQNATILLQNAAAITKCDFYYKMRQYNTLHLSLN